MNTLILSVMFGKFSRITIKYRLCMLPQYIVIMDFSYSHAMHHMDLCRFLQLYVNYGLCVPTKILQLWTKHFSYKIQKVWILCFNNFTSNMHYQYSHGSIIKCMFFWSIFVPTSLHKNTNYVCYIKWECHNSFSLVLILELNHMSLNKCDNFS